MMARKKRIAIFIIILVLIFVILGTGFVLLYLNTDMFKSNKTLFVKYLGQNEENLKTIQGLINEENITENIYNETIQAQINYTDKVGTTDENNENSINNLKISIEGQTDISNGYDYRNIKLLNNNEQVAQAEYLHSNNNYGIKFTDLFNQYLVTENANLKELFRKMGYTEEELQNIPDSLELNTDIINEIKFNDEEIQILKEKYIGIIKQDVSDSNFSRQKNQTITIDGKDYLANAYILTLTKEQLNNMYINILQNIKEDEIVLNKIDILQNKINEITLGKSNTNIKENFIKEIEQTIQKINQSNIGTNETKIIVYENNSKTISTRIETQEYQINIDFIQTTNDIFTEVSILEGDSKKYGVKLNGNLDALSLVIQNNEKQSVFNLTKKKESNLIENYNLEYEILDKKLDINISKTKEEIQNIENIQSFNDENAVILSNLNEEQTKSIIDTVKTEINKEIEEVKQEIKYQDIEQMLKDIGLIKDSTILGATVITETEKNRFNSIFELLQGEKLSGENVISSIETIKNNIGGIEVVSSSELKLTIVRENPDEEVVNTLINFLEEKRNNYNLSLEYDENGLVNALVLTIVEEK